MKESNQDKLRSNEGRTLVIDPVSVVIASERLSDEKRGWRRVAPNHMLTISADLIAEVSLMEVMRLGSNRTTHLKENEL